MCHNEVSQIKNKISHLEKNKIDGGHLNEDQKEFIKKKQKTVIENTTNI